MTVAHRACALVPCYDNPATVRAVVEGIAVHLPDVILVDDGSASPGREVCAELARDGRVQLLRLDSNQGKGAAVLCGLQLAQESGFTHAFQVDADGQHDLAAMPDFLSASREHPDALVLGYPVYDESAPRTRQVARRMTNFWVSVELGGKVAVTDAMIGFRVYPIVPALSARTRTRRMGFDIEVIVRMARAGVAVSNLPVGVRYLPADQGGVSHFRPVLDNLAFGVMHTRLCVSGVFAWALGRSPEWQS